MINLMVEDRLKEDGLERIGVEVDGSVKVLKLLMNWEKNFWGGNVITFKK